MLKLMLLMSIALPAADAELAKSIEELNPAVLSPSSEPPKSAPRDMLADDVTARIREANARETRAWQGIASREDWERLRDDRLAALRRSLGEFPPAAGAKLPLQVRKIGELSGEGYRIERLVFPSRQDLLVTANLYVPAEPRASMPGILICHSHHNPKTERELQDMGILWARLGCLVLVMDQLGHGERRQHPFRTAADYPGEFRVSRQDYHFRYNVALHLQLVGESLIGWMAWDLMRGVDLLLERPGIDPERIILLGAVAGGGDPAAVTAALDPRIAAVVPFNFGGPQPETRSPLPEDAESRFNYAGGGSWESTRNLRLSARDGFLPWVIVGSVAPRRLIYAHEFRWDQPHDPVWNRLQTIFNLYSEPERLAFTHGFGTVQGQPPDASHCNNIGAIHRKMIYPALERWFGIQPPAEENQQRHPGEELLCLTGPEAAGITLTPVHSLCDRLAASRAAEAGRSPSSRSPEEERSALRTAWSKVLGNVEPYTPRVETVNTSVLESLPSTRIERFILTGECNIRVPCLLLIPERNAKPTPGNRLPLIVAVSQQGKAGFLKHRAAWLAELLAGGAAICLPDLRGTGETRPGDGRGRRSEATSLSASELMLGETLTGARLRDLRSLLVWLRSRDDLDAKRIALCGDSFAPVNPPERNVYVPLDVADEPALAEPLGPTLALLGGLFEPDLAAIACARGGLVSFRSVLQSPFLHVPHDALVPGALQAGDLIRIVRSLSPRPVWLAGMVDGLNRAVTEAEATREYGQALGDTSRDSLTLNANPQRLAPWLLNH